MAYPYPTMSTNTQQSEALNFIVESNKTLTERVTELEKEVVELKRNETDQEEEIDSLTRSRNNHMGYNKNISELYDLSKRDKKDTEERFHKYRVGMLQLVLCLVSITVTGTSIGNQYMPITMCILVSNALVLFQFRGVLTTDLFTPRKPSETQLEIQKIVIAMNRVGELLDNM